MTHLPSIIRLDDCEYASNQNPAILLAKKTRDDILDIFEESFHEGRRILTKIGTTGKNEAHEKWLLHLASHIWIYNSAGEILIQKRADSVKVHPGKLYLSAGGHVDTGETFAQTAVLETQEEIGLAIHEKDLEWVGEERENKVFSTNPSYHNNELSAIYILKSEQAFENLQLQQSEVAGTTRMTLSRFANDIRNEKDLAENQCRYPKKSSDYYETIIQAIAKRLEITR